MTPQTDELDRLIDALNAGDASTVNNVEDPELAALMRAVHRIRHLQESDWPDQTVRHLTQELGRSGDSTNMRDAEQPIPEKSSRPVPTPRDPVRHEVPTRRHVSRELAQIAAAILVLVLVGGGLAVVFRNQGPGQPGGIGAAASPTASPSLPMMVTASGITVTVQMVDTASSATRFYVNIALPPYDPGYYESEVFGQSPADNVQVNGMNARATDLHVSENSIGSTRSTDRLWLDYPAPFPTNGMVTLVIKQLWLPAKPERATPTPIDLAKETPVPITMASVNGPWTFHLAAAMFATQPLPTPLSGASCFDVGLSTIPDIDCYSGVSATLAQRMVDFPITEPTPLPASLTRDEFGAILFRLGTTNANRPNYVRFNYPLKSGQPGVSLAETTDPAAMPSINGGTPASGTPVSPFGFTSPPLTIRPGTLATMTIDGVTVTRFEPGDASPREIVFVWRRKDVGYDLSAPYADNSTPPVSESDLQQMVTSIIAQAGASSPTASASPPTGGPMSFDQVQRTVSFYVAQPAWLPSYLVTHGADTAPQSAPTHPPIPIQAVILYYGAADPSQHANVEIDEGISLSAANPLPPGALPPSTTLTIASRSVARMAFGSGSAVTFTWQDQGTSFQMAAQMANPLTEQDVEHMIASMLSPVSGTPSTQADSPVGTPTTSVPLSQERAVWDQIMAVVGADINPVLKPASLPDGFDTIRLEDVGLGDSANPPSFAVEYDGPGKMLLIEVGVWVSRPNCGSGCSLRQITVRGQPAAFQADGTDSISTTYEALSWNEPGTWRSDSGQDSTVGYMLWANGLTVGQFEQIATSLVVVSK